MQLCAYKTTTSIPYDVAIKGSVEEFHQFTARLKNESNLDLRRDDGPRLDENNDDEEQGRHHRKMKKSRFSSSHSAHPRKSLANTSLDALLEGAKADAAAADGVLYDNPMILNGERMEVEEGPIEAVVATEETETGDHNVADESSSAEVAKRHAKLVEHHPMQVVVTFRYRHYQLICTFSYFHRLGMTQGCEDF